MDSQAKTVKDVLRRLVPGMGLVWMWLPLTFVVPWLNSTRPPYIDLTGWIAATAYRLSVSAGSRQGPWVVIVLILVVVSRPGLSLRRRVVEFVATGSALLVLLSGGSVFNEYVVKPGFGVPRPHVVELARPPVDALPDSSLLKMTAEAFYRRTPEERRAYLRAVSRIDALDSLGYAFCFEEVTTRNELRLRRDVCGHWASTTGGFSFPSGHAYSAMFLATLFWGLALSFLSGWRLAFFQFMVVPWTVLVAYSRVVLRVHSPLDITVGGLLGVAVGLMAFVLVRAVIARAGRAEGT